MKRLFLLTIFVLSAFVLLAQAPQGFNYQGVARNAEGEVLPDASLVIRIGILQNDALLWQEDHSVQTNAQGLFSLIIGDREASNTGGSADSFTEIPWGAGGVDLAVSVDPGSGFTDLGTAPLMSVPYALHAQNGWEIRNDTAYSSLPIAIDHRNRESQAPLFEVKNDQGNPVFAVYNDGVVVYVDESKKGAKGGFAVGGYNSAKGTIAQKYAHITPDSVMFWVPENAAEKGVKGGFAVGGYNKNTKGSGLNLLEVTSNHTRIQFDTSNTKGAKGGFAVGGYNKNTKAEPVNLMSLTQKNYLIGENAGRLVDSLGGRRNLMIGYEAGYNTTTGSFNSFIGFRSGYSGRNASGSNNVMIGDNTGIANTSGYSNVFLGNSAGRNNTTGYRNVFIGTSSGYSNTTGQYNAFLGYLSGENNTTGTYNSFFGYRTGRNNSGGDWNAFFGFQAGYNNTVGENNSFFGPNSGFYNTTGNNNSFLGYYSGFRNTTGSNNTYIGYRAGYSGASASGIDNVFIGVEAGLSNTSGSNNIGIGNHAGRNNTTGRYNVYLGTNAGNSNQTADYNTFIGYRSGQNTTAGYNTMVGYNSGTSNTNGTNQAFYGYSAGSANTGSQNTFLGAEAGYYSGGGTGNVYIGLAAGRGCEGNFNVFIGRYAGYGEPDGSNNKLIIHNNYTGDDNLSNALVYGDFLAKDLRLNATVGINRTDSESYGLVVDGGTNSNYSMYVYKGLYSPFVGGGSITSFGNILAYGNISYYGTLSKLSDARLKQDVQQLTGALEKISRINGVYYYWNKEARPEIDLSEEKQIGVIAQDVEEVLPEIVFENQDGFKSVSYHKLTAVLIEAVKEQQKQIESMQAEIDALKAPGN